MDAKTAHSTSRWRLGALLWGAGMLGVLAYVVYLPELLRGVEAAGLGAFGEMPWFAIPAAALQSGVFLALAVWSGVALARRVGLHAPAFEALLSGGSFAAALRPQLLPGLVAGALGAGLLLLLSLVAPAPLAAAEAFFDPPLSVRVLYGGITEELLLRWGLVTLFVWLLWRFVQNRQGAPKTAYVWTAIVTTALLFGVLHLPMASVITSALTASTILYVVLGNAAGGVGTGKDSTDELPILRLSWRDAEA